MNSSIIPWMAAYRVAAMNIKTETPDTSKENAEAADSEEEAERNARQVRERGSRRENAILEE